MNFLDFEIGLMFMPSLREPTRDLVAACERVGISVMEDERELGPFAAVEWMIPTAITLLLTRKYFETLASEAAKEHYPIIRDALQRLFRRVAGAERDLRVRPVVAQQSTNKIAAKELDALSIYVKLDSGQSVRLRVAYDLDETQHAPAIEALHRLLADHYASGASSSLAKSIESQGLAQQRQLYAWYNVDSRRWELWLPGHPAADKRDRST